MLFKQTHSKVILYSTLFGLSALLNGCDNSGRLERFLSADPALKATAEKTTKVSNSTSTSTQDTRLNKSLTENSTNNSLNPNSLNDEKSATKTSRSTSSVAELPDNLPFYPQATLESIAPESTTETGVSEWRSQDKMETIINYYQEKWQGEDWEIIQPFKSNSEGNSTDAIIQQDNLKFKVALTPFENVEGEEEAKTNLKIIYETAKITNSTTAKTTQNRETIDNKNAVTEEKNRDITNNTTIATQTNEPKTNSKNNSYVFSDIEEVPEQLREYIKDLLTLGAIEPKVKDTKTNSFEFKPNEVITRREYAKWLVRANNKYYGNSAKNKIHLGNKNASVAFKDVDVSDRNFAEIQGLAEAGLIPSVLTSDSNNLLFQPDAPLTREDLIMWKVPLDVRKSLAKADITAIKETWGFQDTSKIDPKALPALFADYQNSDRSNVNRIFGYTTLLQPKKAVTRAEAATSLWYFGFQGEGITAKETLKIAQ